MQTFNIDIAQSPAPLVLYAKQGDSLSRFFQINFLESGRPWTPPAGALFAVRYGVPGLPSGWYDTITEPDGSSHSAFGLLGNALTVEIAHEAVSVSGRNTLCVLVLDSNGYQLGAWNLALQVEITPGENAPESTQYYSLLSAQVAQVLASVTDAENAATLAESWAVGGTGTRTGEDTNNAEYWAGQAKVEAQKALGFRTISGAVVPEAGTGDVDPTRAMPMTGTTGKSAADRLDYVVIPGKTTQEGSGDPSPSNVRPITGVGQFGAKIQIPTAGWQTASGLFYKSQVLPFQGQYSMVSSIGINVGDHLPSMADFASASENYEYAVGAFAGQQGITNAGRMYIKAPFSSVEDLQQWLTSSPQWAIYQSATESTQMYTWAAVSGDTYAAVGMELDGPLFDGDSINNNAETPSGRQCEVYRVNGFVTVDGTDTPFTQGTDGYSITLPGAADGPVTACNAFTGLAISSGVCTIPASAFPSSVTSLETANQWAAQNPVQLLYPLATPTTTYSAAQPLVNPAGTWTLSAENTPVGYMRALTDADRADYAEQAKQANNADQLGGHLPAWYAPPGAVIPYAGSSAPDGWLLCDGRTVSRTTYAALFAVIGATYGAGDGKSTFALPNLQGRVAAGTSSSHPLASKAGADSKQITRANLPAEKLNLEDNGIWIVDSVQTGSESGRTLQMGTRSGAVRLETNTLGSGTAFDVRQATLYLNYIIKY